MNREKLAWTVSVLLLALLVFQAPLGLAQRDDDYAFVRTLVDIHRQVANNYVEKIDEHKLEAGAIDGMLNQLDPFSVYVPPQKQKEFDNMLDGAFEGVGIQLNQLDDGRVEVVTPIEGSPAFKAGVQAGDIILKVNGEAIDGMRLPDVINKIKGKLGSEVVLRVRHDNGAEADLAMKRQEIVISTVKGRSRKADNSWDYYVCDDPRIAYVRLTQFTPDTYENVRKALEGLLQDNMRGLVLDLRWNPGGRLDEATKIVNLFLKAGQTIVSTKGRNRAERIEKATADGTLPYFPMVVLVNEHSASASEIVAGSLMDNHRAEVIGVRTYGKGSVQELMPLEGNNGELKLTVAYYYLPSGRLVHRKKDAKDWGVEPRVVVPMDEAAQRKVLQARYDDELLKHPHAVPATTEAATGPATMPHAAAGRPATTRAAAATTPATQPAVDAQLDAAVLALKTAIDIYQSAPTTVPFAAAVAPAPPQTQPAPPAPPAGPAPAPTAAPATEPAPETAPEPATAP